MQVGDPLSLIPAFKDVPRNLGVIKTMQIGIDQNSGDYQLAAVNGNILGTESPMLIVRVCLRLMAVSTRG